MEFLPLCFATHEYGVKNAFVVRPNLEVVDREEELNVRADAPELFEQARMARLLVGDVEEIQEGLCLIHYQLRDRTCGWLRSRYPGMSAEDLADAWGDTLLGVLKAAREGRFDPDRPLMRWLLTIAYRRAADITRRNTSWQRLTGEPRQQLSALGLDNGLGTGARAAEDAVADALSTSLIHG